MPELDVNQYKTLQHRVNIMQWDYLVNYLDNYTYYGRRLEMNDFPNAQGQRRMDLQGYFIRRPDPNADAEWDNIEQKFREWNSQSAVGNLVYKWDDEHADFTTPSNALESLVSNINDYINHFPNCRHIDDARVYLTQLDQDESCLDYLSRLNNRYLPVKDNLVKVFEIYKSEQQFFNAQNADVALLGIHQKVFEKLNSCIIPNLKARELELMRQNYQNYPLSRLRDLVKLGIFSRDELVNANVITNSLFDCYIDINDTEFEQREIGISQQDIINAFNTSRPGDFLEDATDVYFFGLPGTGKTCVLQGLIHSNQLIWNSTTASGPYGSLLYSAVDRGFVLDKTNVMATINATIQDTQSRWYGGNKKVIHNINFVEMPGEEFLRKIAQNPQIVNLTFAALADENNEELATRHLNSNRHKLFFIVVDPTSWDVYDAYTGSMVNQHTALMKIADLCRMPENKAVMKNVEGIYVIVTKADTLGDNDDDIQAKMNNLLNQHYTGLLQRIREAINTTVKILPFSLGHFYVGNVFEYDDSYSKKLVDFIKQATRVND